MDTVLHFPQERYQTTDRQEVPGRLLTATRRAHPQERREQSRGSPEHEQGSDEGEGGWSNVDQDMHVHAGGVGRGVEEEEGEEEGDWTDWLTCKRPLSSRCRWCSTSASPCSRSRNATFMRPGTRSTLYSSRRRDSTISKCNSPMPEHTGRERSRERVCVFTHSQTHAHTSTQTQTQTHTAQKRLACLLIHVHMYTWVLPLNVVQRKLNILHANSRGETTQNKKHQ